MKKNLVFSYILFVIVSIVVISIILLYLNYINLIYGTIKIIEGGWLAFIAIIMRAFLSFSMAIVLVRRWFLQENQYFSDIPFLFSIFFLFHGFGKLIDIINFFTYYWVNENELLYITKIRIFIAVATLFPMMYLSVMMVIIFLSLKTEEQKYSNEKERQKITKRIIMIIIIIEILITFLISDLDTAVIIFPIIVIPSLVIIVWIMFFSYKYKRLSQIHPLIVAIGFSIYLFASILRPIMIYIIGYNVFSIIFAEIFEMATFLIIFIGLLIKVNYKEMEKNIEK